jgi:FtsZ-interacting cell division protein ZipA
MEFALLIVLAILITVPVIVAIGLMIRSLWLHRLEQQSGSPKESSDYEIDLEASTREVTRDDRSSRSAPKLRQLVIENIRKKRNGAIPREESTSTVASSRVVSTSEQPIPAPVPAN